MANLFDEIRERDVERPSKEYAKKRRWWVMKVLLSDRNGVPDGLFIRSGRVIFIEFKAPGELPSGQQLKRHKEIRDQGIAVFVVDDFEVAKTILR